MRKVEIFEIFMCGKCGISLQYMHISAHNFITDTIREITAIQSHLRLVGVITTFCPLLDDLYLIAGKSAISE